MTGAPVTDADLHALVDDRLDEVRRADVERHLADNPADADRVAAWRRIDEGLHELFDGELHRPVPDSWLRPPRGALLARWRDRPMAAAALLLVAVFLGGGAAGWFAHRASPETAASSGSRIVAFAAEAHEVYVPEVRHPVEVPANEEQHLVRWLTKRLGATVRAPQLSSLGYKLMGGRLLPSGQTIAAQFMYEDPSGQRLTLYIKKAGPRGNEQTAFRFQEFQGVAVFYWLDSTCGYALVSAVPREKLLHVARVVYDQFNR